MDAPHFPDPTDTELLRIEQAHPHLRVEEEALRRRIRRVAEGEDARLAALTVVLTGHDDVLELNREHLEHDYVTDVLSFALSEDDASVSGEIYVDLDTARERHEEFDASFEEEVHRYVVHGLLHLMGYDDRTSEGEAAMRRREDRYLRVNKT
jgi:rRNA maturation RNase YbeY